MAKHKRSGEQAGFGWLQFVQGLCIMFCLISGTGIAEDIPATVQTLAPLPDSQPQEPILPLPLKIAVDPAKVALGERLFNDTRLSQDNSMACASCHPLDRGGVDGLPRARTVKGAVLTRNTPTVFNSGFNFFFNWDGVVDSLEAHAERLLFSSAVMMNTTWPELLVRLQAEPSYVTAFASVYPQGMTQATVLDALASYERSLITPNSRFDRFLRGEQQALTEEERQGYQLFKSYGCVACHQGMNVGGNMFQKFGIFLGSTPAPAATPGDLTDDPGRYQVTKIDRDRHVFRVPSLRNVALTAPYFHDGGAPTLERAVAIMAKAQLGKSLTAEENHLIVQFLHTLTGEYHGQPLATPGPR